MDFLRSTPVKNAFPDYNRNKYMIAAALAKQLPAIGPKLPPVRKIWTSEDYRMSIFDAAAFGVAYFRRDKSTEHDSFLRIQSIKSLARGAVGRPRQHLHEQRWIENVQVHGYSEQGRRIATR